MEFSVAEQFLMGWACLTTILFIYIREKYHRAKDAHSKVAVLLAKVCMGDVKPKPVKDGFISVEDDNMRMVFKKKEDEVEL